MAIYLVTGGSGFIGSHLCEALVGRGDAVRVLDDLSTGSPENLPEQVALVRGDLERVLGEPVVVHDEEAFAAVLVTPGILDAPAPWTIADERAYQRPSL